MKTLSVQQPWAWLIVHGYKPVENRTWSTSYRGPLLIHAGKTVDVSAYAWLQQHFPMLYPAVPHPEGLERGGIVGRVTLARTVHERDDDLRLSDAEARWFFGPCGLVLREASLMRFRPLRGQLGLFEVPDA